MIPAVMGKYGFIVVAGDGVVAGCSVLIFIF